MVLVGEGEGSEARVVSVSQDPDGLRVVLDYGGATHALFAPLYGLHHGRNMAIAFVTALAMGVDAESATIAMRSTPQIAHRLEVKRLADGTTIIDDGYNSNPKGFASGLEILPLLVGPGGRRILVTPGMVELGPQEEEENRRLGELAAAVCDVCLLAGPLAPHIRAGLVGAGFDEGGIIVAPDGPAAHAELAKLSRRGDVILFENDLPDVYG
jgi:UDP-N-acetylmuramoyl-tripeptide--D-alanyl-D-alanine ligase